MRGIGNTNTVGTNQTFQQSLTDCMLLRNTLQHLTYVFKMLKHLLWMKFKRKQK